MQVSELKVERRPSYDTDFPNQLVGTVKMNGSLGVQEVRISNAGLARIFKVISDEVQETARKNADMVQRSMEDATNEPLMLAASKIEQD